MHYFISDTHFCESRPEHVDLFVAFCAKEPVMGDSVVLLGDIFEVWVGDDVRSTTSRSIEKAIRSMASKGIKVYFMPGNRDFLVGESFAESSMFEILEDPCIWKFPSGDVSILTHGDVFCTHDKAYRRFRNITRNEWVKKAFLLLPKSTRMNIADSMRAASKKSQTGKSSELLDVSTELVEKMFGHYEGIDTIIMGHTHRPKIHRNGSKTRIVLGDWGDYIWIGRYGDEKRFDLMRQGVKNGATEVVDSVYLKPILDYGR